MRVNINATLTFGLVSMPVGVATAAKRNEAKFRVIHSAREGEEDCNSPIKMPVKCPVHERELMSDEVGKGYEYAKGQILPIDEEELMEMVAEKSTIISIEKFVPTGDVAPYVELDYYLVPAPALLNQYLLLYNAMAKRGVSGLGKSVLWGVEKPCAVHSTPNGIQLSMLFCEDEIRSASEIRALLGTKTNFEEQKLANLLVDTISARLVPEEDLVSPSQQRVSDYIAAKLEGTEIKPLIARDVPEATPNIAEVLKKSISDAQKRSAKTARKPARRQAVA